MSHHHDRNYRRNKRHGIASQYKEPPCHQEETQSQSNTFGLTDLLYLPTHRLQGDGYINNPFALTEYILGNKKSKRDVHSNSFELVDIRIHPGLIPPLEDIEIGVMTGES